MIKDIKWCVLMIKKCPTESVEKQREMRREWEDNDCGESQLSQRPEVREQSLFKSPSREQKSCYISEKRKIGSSFDFGGSNRAAVDCSAWLHHVGVIDRTRNVFFSRAESKFDVFRGGKQFSSSSSPRRVSKNMLLINIQYTMLFPIRLVFQKIFSARASASAWVCVCASDSSSSLYPSRGT